MFIYRERKKIKENKQRGSKGLIGKYILSYRRPHISIYAGSFASSQNVVFVLRFYIIGLSSETEAEGVAETWQVSHTRFFFTLSQKYSSTQPSFEINSELKLSVFFTNERISHQLVLSTSHSLISGMLKVAYLIPALTEHCANR